MKNIFKEIEKKTNNKVVLLSEIDLQTGIKYQLVLVSKEYGATAYFSIIRVNNDGFYFVDDCHSLLKCETYATFCYTIREIEEVLEDANNNNR